MKLSQIIWSIVFFACVAGGGISGYMMQNKKKADAADITLNEPQSICTDELSLRIFQNAINDKSGNIIVAPRVLCDALQKLKSVAGGKTLQELEALNIANADILHNADIARCVLITADINVPRVKQAKDILALPFSENYPLALSMFNSSLANYAFYENMQFATSDITSSKTKLLGGCVSFYSPRWEIPIHKSNTQQADFDSASGRLPKYNQMRSRGNFLTAKAEDGTWQAVALPIQAKYKKGEALSFVLIQPSESARAFAVNLTPDTLTSIRAALAKAQPADTLVSLPRFGLSLDPQDIRANLKQLGLNSLYSDTEADFSGYTTEKIHLSAMIFACGITVQESAGSTPADENLEHAANHIDFARPFLWFIGDLSTDTPMDFMGLVEEL